MREFDLEIVTPDGVEFSGKAESVIVRTDDGDVQILAGHVEYMASLGTGKVKLIADGTERIAAASGGFITVSGGEVKLVAITFEFSDDIDLSRAKRAKERAEEQIRNAQNDKELVLAKAKLKRAISRISAASEK